MKKVGKMLVLSSASISNSLSKNDASCSSLSCAPSASLSKFSGLFSITMAMLLVVLMIMQQPIQCGTILSNKQQHGSTGSLIVKRSVNLSNPPLGPLNNNKPKSLEACQEMIAMASAANNLAGEKHGNRVKKSPFDDEGIRYKKSPFDDEGIRYKKSPFDDEGIRYKKAVRLPFQDEGIRYKKSPFDDEGIRYKKSPFDDEGIRYKKSPFDDEGIRYKKRIPFDDEGIRYKKSSSALFDDEHIRF